MKNFESQGRSNHPCAPGWSVLLITKSDTVNIADAAGDAVLTRAILVNQDTVAKVTTAEGVDVAAVPLQKGYNPLRVKRVWSTGTDAVNVYAIY